MTDKLNIITATDSYKLGHWNQYPANTRGVYSYFEARKGARFPETVFFGLQPLLEILEKGVRHEDVLEAASLSEAIHGRGDVFNFDGWMHIIDVHNGRLPVRIKAVPEGTVVPINNVMMTVENTDPACYWLTNALESFLTHIWHTCTVATLSREIKKDIAGFLDRTSDNKDGLPFMLHDFGYRGAVGHEAAAAGGAAHLVNFLGTDTVPAMQYMLKHYAADLGSLGFSVPATEHSVMTAIGKAGESKQVERMIENNPTGIISVVADSYNIYDFVDNFVCWKFKDAIMARDGKFVVRPDSVTPEHPTKPALVVDLLRRLHASYPGPVNEKGYKTLDPHVGVLYGDGLDGAQIHNILEAVTNAGFSADVMVFGMGGGLHQSVDRDTQRFAFKCSAQKRNGVWSAVQKNPLDQSKASKAGRLKLVKSAQEFATVVEGDTLNRELLDELVTVFEDGKITQRYDLAGIRERAAI